MLGLWSDYTWGMHSQEWCWSYGQTTLGARTHSSCVRLEVRQHIGHELASVVLGLWSDNTWGTNSQQRCCACSQTTHGATGTLSSGIGLVVRQHIRYEHIAVEMALQYKNLGHELTAVVLGL
jgi:hypothetical protein